MSDEVKGGKQIMKYKINDIAKRFHLSKQMIRYYEQCGVIHVERTSNNYRQYDTMDYFALSEAMSLSNFNVSIKDIKGLTATEYQQELSNCYLKFIKETEEELEYKNLLKQRAEELLERIEQAEMNIGNIWIKKIPAYTMYPLMKSVNDEYGQIEVPDSISEFIHSSKALSFFNGIFEMYEDYNQWYLSIIDKYSSILPNVECKEARHIDEQFCLCTMINMGEIGDFKTEMIKEKIKELSELSYEFFDSPRCLLLCRGTSNNEFRRILELQIPIKKK